MRILFVNNFRERGGGEEFLRDLLPGLSARGAKVGLICRYGTPLVEMFKNSEITLHPIRRSGLQGVTAVFKTAKVIRDHGYDIIDIQRGHDLVQSWLGAKLSGRRPALIYTPQVAEFLKSRFLLSRMNKIVTISRHIRDTIISFFPGIASRISIIYYGIDLDTFKPGDLPRSALRNRFGFPLDTPIIGAVGDLWKNQIEFLDALVLIKKELPHARFALVSPDTGSVHIEQFKRRAASLGLIDSVHWTGRLAKQDMPSFYAAIDIAVNTHRNEGFGIWVLEALAAGKPVVSVNKGGIRDSLEDCPAGMLVEGGSTEMASAVVTILKDASLKTRMAEAGPKWIAERFSRERMVEDYHGLFLSLLSNQQGVDGRGLSQVVSVAAFQQIVDLYAQCLIS